MKRKSKIIDVTLWSLVITIVSMVAALHFYYFSSTMILQRWLVDVSCVFIIAALLYRTALGNSIWQLWLDAWFEVRKVVWPTKKETVHTTMIVLAMVVITSLLLWLVDSILIKLLGYIFGL